MKIFTRLIIVTALWCFGIVMLAYSTRAETMFSNSFQLKFGNFNMTSGNKTSSGYSLTDTVGQTAAEYFTSSGYTIGAGAQYLYNLYDFSFSVSTTSLDFGSLLLNHLNQTSFDLSVTAPRQGYTITTIASSQLKNGVNLIPPTSCNTSCTTSLAGIWTNVTSYGFGYNITGDDKASDFTSTSHFRPFPDLSAGDQPAIIMASINAGKNRQATATLQLVLSPTQPVGTYENHIYLIAIPNY